MKPSQLPDAIRAAIQARQPLFVWGPPGIGKSQIVEQATRAMNYHYKMTRAALMDPIEAMGIPSLADGRTRWNPPAHFPTEEQAGSGLVWFFDEFNQAAPSVQAALAQLLDRDGGGIGDYRRPANVHIIAAGNRETDRAAAQRMPTHIKNRFAHVDLAPDLDDWTTWAIKADLEISIIAYVRFKETDFFSFDPSRPDRAFPTPRSWHAASDILKTQPAPAIRFDLIRGLVGDGAASGFLAFEKIYMALPNLDHVISHPDAAPVPEDPAALYAMSAGLARRSTPQTFNNVARYLKRLPREFEILTIKQATKSAPELVNTAAYIGHVAENKDLYL